jgi:glycosyltransferase involved in cell wall biosynthesis
VTSSELRATAESPDPISPTCADGSDEADRLRRFLAPWLERRPVLAVDRPLSPRSQAVACQEERITSFVLADIASVAAAIDSARLGRFHDPPYDWSLPPRRSSVLAFWGPRRRLTAAMLRTARQAGVRRIVHMGPTGPRDESTVRLLGDRLIERARQALVRCVPPLDAWIGRASLSRFTTWLAAAPPRRSQHRTPRVALVNHSLSMGGTERQLVNTAAALRQRGFADVTLVCERRHDYGRRDPFGAALQAMAVPIVEIPDAVDAGYMQHLTGYQRAARGLPTALVDDALFYAALFLRLRPDVVHAWQDASAVKAGLGAVLAGVPRIVLSLRSLRPSRFNYGTPWMWPAYRALADRANVAIVANSAAGARDYAAWLGLPTSRIAVVLNAVEPRRWPRRDDPEVADFCSRHGLHAAPVVGSIFRFYREKDPILWLRAAALTAARRRDARFLIVGDGPMRSRMEAEASRLGLAGRLHLIGELDDPAVALAAMDVFVLTSVLEGLPNVVLEAQAAGVPVVATDAGGAAEALDPGRTGLIVARNRKALATATLRVLDDEAWAAAARAAGPRFVAARFGAERMLDGLLPHYAGDDS